MQWPGSGARRGTRITRRPRLHNPAHPAFPGSPTVEEGEKLNPSRSVQHPGTRALPGRMRAPLRPRWGSCSDGGHLFQAKAWIDG
jgi:hypothetical protein